MEIKYLSVLLCILVMGCNKFNPETKHKIDIFSAKGMLAWQSTFEADIQNPESFLSGKPVAKPVLTWQSLLKLNAYGKSGNQVDTFCIYYLIPLLSEKYAQRGILKTVKIDPRENCENLFVRESFSQLDGIEELTVWLSDNSKNLKEENYNLLPNTLTMKLKINSRTVWLEFPLMNLPPLGITYLGDRSVGKSNIKHSKFASGLMETSIPGVQLFPVLGISEGPIGRKGGYLGNWNDTYQDKKLMRCRSLSYECKKTDVDICEMCRYGSFSVVSANCVEGSPKYCAPNRCGEKGEPACHRGFSYIDGIPAEACFENSPAGYCLPGLRTFCDENKTLICL